MAKKPSARKKRDPFWRFRRALGAQRIGGAKGYKRSAERRAERDARESGKDERQP